MKEASIHISKPLHPSALANKDFPKMRQNQERSNPKRISPYQCYPCFVSFVFVYHMRQEKRRRNMRRKKATEVLLLVTYFTGYLPPILSCLPLLFVVMVLLNFISCGDNHFFGVSLLFFFIRCQCRQSVAALKCTQSAIKGMKN